MDGQVRIGELTLEEIEKIAILETLKKNNFNRTHTARTLQIGIRTLQRKIRQYQEQGCEVPDFQGFCSL
jgi:transcriptional regulator with PAS, ATPase and Fis domain